MENAFTVGVTGGQSGTQTWYFRKGPKREAAVSNTSESSILSNESLLLPRNADSSSSSLGGFSTFCISRH